MKITIVGGGNIGTQFAAHCAEKGNRVRVYTSKPDKFSKTIEIVNKNGDITHSGEIDCATNDVKIAFDDADIIFITVPAFMLSKVAENILPFVHSQLKIGLIPGTGGGECVFKTAIEKGATVFGIQRVPSVARLREYGRSVCATGYRHELHVASIPSHKVSECCILFKDIFDIGTVALPNYLCVTLTPSNSILHTTRLRTLFADYGKTKVYSRIPLFYEEWSDASSELLFQCDEEVQNICRALVMFDLQSVKSLREHYESETPTQLTQKMRSIESLKGLLTPMLKTIDGFIPDFESRYFTADFPFGLEIIRQIGEHVGIPTVHIHETMEWYWKMCNRKERFRYSDYGINSLSTMESYYLQ